MPTIHHRQSSLFILTHHTQPSFDLWHRARRGGFVVNVGRCCWWSAGAALDVGVGYAVSFSCCGTFILAIRAASPSVCVVTGGIAVGVLR